MEFWPEYREAAGAFCMGEVHSGDSAYVAPYQHALDSLLNYPQYWALRNVFIDGQPMERLVNGLQEQV